MRPLFWLALILLVIFRFSVTRPVYRQGDLVKISGTVRTEPLRYSNSQSLTLAGLKIYLDPYPELNYGDHVVIEGRVQDQKLLSARLISHQESSAFFFTLRERLLQVYRRALPEPHSALISGITLGSKSSLPSEFYAGLKRSGTLHVVVASGMNVSFVAAFVLSLLLLFISRKKAVIIVLFSIWIYALLSGFDAPIIRAALMGSIAFSAQGLGKLYSAWRALFLSASFMLLISPDWLWDLGFILSFVATASLLLFEQKIARRLQFLPYFFREGLSTSLAAQVGVAPILFVTFGQFNPLSPLINALILWTVPPLIIAGALAGIIGLFVPIIARVILLITFPLTWWFVKVVTVFG